MHVPLLPLVNNTRVYVQGDVSIDANAAIAPGVILQADPDCRISIAAGACIGMGVILHAHQGDIEIESGAVLGTGVLVVGRAKIGANACIGAATTIWNHSVEPSQVLPAASLLAVGQVEPKGEAIVSTEAAPLATETQAGEINGQSPPATAKAIANPTPEPTKAIANPTPEPTEVPPPAQSVTSVTVYGKANLNQLLLTLFPHKTVNPSPKDDDTD